MGAIAGHEDAFLADVIANPDDDAPRLIYADWLEDQGRPERAEFIRVQCELGGMGRPWKTGNMPVVRHLGGGEFLERERMHDLPPVGARVDVGQLPSCRRRLGLLVTRTTPGQDWMGEPTTNIFYRWDQHSGRAAARSRRKLLRREKQLLVLGDVTWVGERAPAHLCLLAAELPRWRRGFMVSANWGGDEWLAKGGLALSCQPLRHLDLFTWWLGDTLSRLARFPWPQGFSVALRNAAIGHHMAAEAICAPGSTFRRLGRLAFVPYPHGPASDVLATLRAGLPGVELVCRRMCDLNEGWAVG